jgi:hypothetical protein
MPCGEAHESAGPLSSRTSQRAGTSRATTSPGSGVLQGRDSKPVQCRTHPVMASRMGSIVELLFG